MDLSNYSMEDLIQEWIMDRARAPKLLQRAVELRGIDAVVAFAVENGVPKGAIMFALRRAGCVGTTAQPRAPLTFEEKVAKLWRRDRSRFEAIVEKLYEQD